MKTTNNAAIFVELDNGVVKQTNNIDVVNNFPLTITVTQNYRGGRSIRVEKVKRISAGKYTQ